MSIKTEYTKEFENALNKFVEKLRSYISVQKRENGQ